MSRCYYCTTDEKVFKNLPKPDHFTNEHVLPRSIGGAITHHNPFLLRRHVCSWCNALCGRYVDAPYSRNWITQIRATGTMWRTIDVRRHPAVPLAYLGTFDVDTADGTQCDAWLGPADTYVAHFHQPYPIEPQNGPIAGRPVHVSLDDIDPGYAFVFVSATNPAWHRTIIASVTRGFRRAPLYLANGTHPHPRPFVPIPYNRTYLLPILIAHLDTNPSPVHTVAFKPDYDTRFKAKMALGMGALFLKRRFIFSPDSDLLRPVLYGNSTDLSGTNAFEGSDEMQRLLAWDDNHVLYLHPFSGLGIIALHLVLFGQSAQIVRISSDLSHWPDTLPDTGVVFVAAPGLQQSVGPIEFHHYMRWKADPTTRGALGLTALDDLHARLQRVRASMPPISLP